MSDLQIALQVKLDGWRAQNRDFTEREEIARLLADAETISRQQLAKVKVLEKQYGGILLAIVKEDLGATERAGKGVLPKQQEAEAILTGIGRAEKVHKELQALAVQTAAHPQRKVGDLAAIRAAIAEGQGMAEALEARIAKLAQ